MHSKSKLFDSLNELFIGPFCCRFAVSDHTYGSNILLPVDFLRQHRNMLPVLSADLHTRKMSNQCILQSISKSYCGSFQGLIVFHITDTYIEICLLSVGIHNNECGSIICRQGIEHGGELVSNRFTFFIYHFGYMIKTDILNQIFFQRKHFPDRNDLHFG